MGGGEREGVGADKDDREEDEEEADRECVMGF